MSEQNREKTPYQLDLTYNSELNIILQVIIDHLELKDEDDFMYKKGEAQGQKLLQLERERSQHFTAGGLLDATNLTAADIIRIFGIPAILLQSVKKDLAAAPSKIARLKKTLSAEKIAQQLNLPINWVEKQIAQA